MAGLPITIIKGLISPSSHDEYMNFDDISILGHGEVRE